MQLQKFNQYEKLCECPKQKINNTNLIENKLLSKGKCTALKLKNSKNSFKNSAIYGLRYSRINQVKFVKAAFKKFV